MKKLLSYMAIALLLTACGSSSERDEFDITSKFIGTWNIYEKVVQNDDGSVTYTSVPWGGLMANMKERNYPVDWTAYEAVTFEFAEPTKVETQAVLSGIVSTWGRKGITSLTCHFDGQNVSAVTEVALQTADSTTLTVKSVRLSPAASVWDSTPIWEGRCEVGNWENGIIIDKSQFETAIAGDKLEIAYTTDQSDPTRVYWQVKTVYYDGENQTTLQGNDSELNDWGCASVSRDATLYRIMLTDKDVSNLKRYGLYLNGYYTIITRCSLLRRDFVEGGEEGTAEDVAADDGSLF